MFQTFYSKLSEKEKKFFNITVLIVVLALFDRLFLGPFLGKLHDIDQQISQQKMSVTRDLRFLSYEDKILDENAALSKYFAQNIEDDDVVNASFLREIEILATKSNVNLVKSNPALSEKKNSFIEYYANLDCTGKLDDVITFMHSINTTDELLKIVKFNMTPKKGEGNEVNASMTVLKMVVTPNSSAQEDKEI